MKVTKDFIDISSPHRKWMWILVIIFVTISVFRITSTYHLFNATYDENQHLLSGIELFDRGSYLYGPDHPPLARIAVALGPYLAGTRLSNQQRAYLTDWEQNRAAMEEYEEYSGSISRWHVGTELLHAGQDYFRTLSLARLGILPFFVLTLAITWVWGRAILGDSVAFLSMLLLSTLPSVLGHGGLATTDMVLTCCFLIGVISFSLWLKTPNVFFGSLFGATWGLAALSKFSALLFLPSCAAMIIFWRYLFTRSSVDKTPQRHRTIRKRLSTLFLAGLVAFLVVWAGYSFSLSPLGSRGMRPYGHIDKILGASGTIHNLAYAVVETPVPLGKFVLGVKMQKKRNDEGHMAYLLGNYSLKGWWYYFPIVFAIKTPFPFMFLVIVGFVTLGRFALLNKDWRLLVPILCAVTIMLVVIPAKINIGSRYILPIFPFLALIAGYGAVFLWRLKTRTIATRCAVIILLGWHVVSTTLAHPDYLAYFNEIASNSPERFVVDSDLDWGQDLYRLSVELKKRDIDELALAYFGSEDPKYFGLPLFRILEPYETTTGWVAISMTKLMDVFGNQHDGYAWLQKYKPVAIIGKSIKLYYVPTK